MLYCAIAGRLRPPQQLINDYRATAEVYMSLHMMILSVPKEEVHMMMCDSVSFGSSPSCRCSRVLIKTFRVAGMLDLHSCMLAWCRRLCMPVSASCLALSHIAFTPICVQAQSLHDF